MHSHSTSDPHPTHMTAIPQQSPLHAPHRNRKFPRRILPGFGFSLSYTLIYLTVIVLLPMIGLGVRAFQPFWTMEFSAAAAKIWKDIAAPTVLASYWCSFGISFFAAALNGVFGVLLAWALVRYKFPGRRLIDALVDLPFALPTAVAGIALSALYAKTGWIGKPIFEWTGFQIAYTQVGIFVALTFIGLPFVVRTVQPVIEDLALEYEEAAASLGASRWYTLRRVVLPAIFPAMLTGSVLAYGRAIGEFGSVIFIAGNKPGQTQITPWIIVEKLEQFNYSGAAALGFVMVGASFVILLGVNLIHAWQARRTGRH